MPPRVSPDVGHDTIKDQPSVLIHVRGRGGDVEKSLHHVQLLRSRQARGKALGERRGVRLMDANVASRQGCAGGADEDDERTHAIRRQMGFFREPNEDGTLTESKDCFTRDDGEVEGCFDGSTTRRFISTASHLHICLAREKQRRGRIGYIFFSVFCTFLDPAFGSGGRLDVLFELHGVEGCFCGLHRCLG